MRNGTTWRVAMVNVPYRMRITFLHGPLIPLLLYTQQDYDEAEKNLSNRLQFDQFLELSNFILSRLPQTWKSSQGICPVIALNV